MSVPSKSELKTLRKEWRELKKDYESLYKQRPRCYSGDVIDTTEWYRILDEHYAQSEPIKQDLLKRAVYLAAHDTPFIKRQMASWAKHNFYMKHVENDDWQCGTDEHHIVITRNKKLARK